MSGFLTWTQTMVYEVKTFHMGGAENMHVFVGIYEYCFRVFTDM